MPCDQLEQTAVSQSLEKNGLSLVLTQCYLWC